VGKRNAGNDTECRDFNIRNGWNVSCMVFISHVLSWKYFQTRNLLLKGHNVRNHVMRILYKIIATFYARKYLMQCCLQRVSLYYLLMFIPTFQLATIQEIPPLNSSFLSLCYTSCFSDLRFYKSVIWVMENKTKYFY
jgi:hypothetical protein